MNEQHLPTPAGMVQADGLVTVATTFGKGVKLPAPTDESLVVAQWWFPTPWKYCCGHWGPWSFRLKFWGDESGWLKQWARCPECHLAFLKKESIRCCRCKLPIFPWDLVFLWSIPKQGLDVSTCTFVGKDSVIGCTRAGCGDGTVPWGYWTEEGYHPLVFK